MRSISRSLRLILLGFLAGTPSALGQTPISISFPSGVPLVLSPSAVTPVHIVVSPGTDTLVPNSVRLFRRAGLGAFQQIALTPGAGGSCSGELPAGTCGTGVEWYVAAGGVTSGIVTEPPGGADSPFVCVVGMAVPVASYNFQSAPGWTVNGNAAAGVWALGVPVGCNRGDPPADYDGSGSCFLTQPSTANFPAACDTDVDAGTTYLISPLFDLTALANPHVCYARWYSNAATGESADDTMRVTISDNGGISWLTAEIIGPSANDPHPETSGGWYPRILRLSDFTPNHGAIRVRFAALDLGAFSTVEAGIDAFAIIDLSCQQSGCLRGDMNGDASVDGRDVKRFAALLVGGGAGPAEICAGDLESNPDGSLDVGDVGGFVNCIIAGGCP